MSRELKVCRFSQSRHLRRKSRHSPRPGTGLVPEKLPFPPLLPPALHLLWGCYIAKTPLHLEKIPSKASAQLFILQPPHLQTERPWKAEKTHVSCLLSGEIQEQSLPTWRPDCGLISWLFSPHRELLTLGSHRPCELTDFPGPNPARPTLLPLLRLKPSLISHNGPEAMSLTQASP